MGNTGSQSTFNVTSLGVIHGGAWCVRVDESYSLSGCVMISLARRSWRWKRAVEKACWEAEWAAAQRQPVPNGWHDRCLFAQLLQNIPRSARHFRHGVNSDKSDVALLRPPVGWRTGLPIYGWILWSCVTPLSTLQHRRRNLFTDRYGDTHWQACPLSKAVNYYNYSSSSASIGVFN